MTGTDATIAQHIQMIIDRGYVAPKMQGATKYLAPSGLGIALVDGYNEIGFDKSLSKPHLRREVRSFWITSARSYDMTTGLLDRATHGASVSGGALEARHDDAECGTVQGDIRFGEEGVREGHLGT